MGNSSMSQSFVYTEFLAFKNIYRILQTTWAAPIATHYAVVKKSVLAR